MTSAFLMCSTLFPNSSEAVHPKWLVEAQLSSASLTEPGHSHMLGQNKNVTTEGYYKLKMHFSSNFKQMY